MFPAVSLCSLLFTVVLLPLCYLDLTSGHGRTMPSDDLSTRSVAVISASGGEADVVVNGQI